MSTDYSDDQSRSSGLPAIDVHRSILVLEPVQSHIGLDPVPLVDPSGYVLGHSADCDLVIRAQGIQARHCEIYFDQGALCVRAWDDKSWLNDMPLLDSRLQNGDRLSLGPVEFCVRQATSDELLIDQLRRDQDVKSVFRSRNRNSATDSDGRPAIEFDEQYRTLLRFLGERQCTLSDLLQTIDNLHTAESRILHAQRKEDLIKELTSELQEVASELRQQEETLRSDQRSSEDSQRDGLSQDLEQLNLLRNQLIDERQDWEDDRQSAQDQFDARENQIADYERALEQRTRRWETDRGASEQQIDMRRAENEETQIRRISELDKRARVLQERELVREQWVAELERKECELAAGWQVVREQQAVLLEAMSSVSQGPDVVESELDDLRAHLVSERWQLQQVRHEFLKRCAGMGVDVARFLPHIERLDDSQPLRPADWDSAEWTETTIRDLLAALRGVSSGSSGWPVVADNTGAAARHTKRSVSIFGPHRAGPQTLGLRYLLCSNAIGLGALLFMQARYAGGFAWGAPLQLETMGWASIAIGGLGLLDVFLQRGFRRMRRMSLRWIRRSRGATTHTPVLSRDAVVTAATEDRGDQDWEPADSDSKPVAAEPTATIDS